MIATANAAYAMSVSVATCDCRVVTLDADAVLPWRPLTALFSAVWMLPWRVWRAVVVDEESEWSRLQSPFAVA
jgi:hypothetical protein